MGSPGHVVQAWGLGLARAKQDPISSSSPMENRSRTYNRIGRWTGKLTRKGQGWPDLTDRVDPLRQGEGAVEWSRR